MAEQQLDHVALNRSMWDEDAPNWVAAGERAWNREVPVWGQWALSDEAVGLLPDRMKGLDAIELGCGTGYVSRWMERRGATVVAVDVSASQLSTARRLAEKHSSSVIWLQADAECVPYPDGSFDFAVSEYGAALWCDPFVWIPEAVRLLRADGRLAFLTTSPMVTSCYALDGSPAAFDLVRPYFGQHRFDWTSVEIDPGGVEFNLTITDWFALFRDSGLEVLEFRELQAPAGATGTPFAIPAEWAQRYPSEIAWRLRKMA